MPPKGKKKRQVRDDQPTEMESDYARLESLRQQGQVRGAQGFSDQRSGEEFRQQGYQRRDQDVGPQRSGQQGVQRGAQAYDPQGASRGDRDFYPQGPQRSGQQGAQRGDQGFGQQGLPRSGQQGYQREDQQYGQQGSQRSGQQGAQRGDQGFGQQGLPRSGQQGYQREDQQYGQRSGQQSFQKDRDFGPQRSEQRSAQRGAQGFHQQGPPRSGQQSFQGGNQELGQQGSQRSGQQFKPQVYQRGAQELIQQSSQIGTLEFEQKDEQTFRQHVIQSELEISSKPSESFPPKTEKNVPKGWKQPVQHIQPEVVKQQQKVDLPIASPSSSTMSKNVTSDIKDLQSEMSSLTLQETKAILKQPTSATTQAAGSGDQASTSSSSPVDSASTQISPKKPPYIALKMNYKISPTDQQKFLPKRPDSGGTKGREIKLIINCLDMKVKPMKIFMYDIDLTKADMTVNGKVRDEKVKMQRKETLREIVYDFLKYKGGLPVFDGGKIIFTNRMLEIDNSIVNKVVFDFIKDGEKVTCHFNLQRVREENIDFSDLSNYVESRAGRSDNLPQEALRALDTIIKEMFINKNLISLNRRAIFDPKTAKPLRCGPYLLLDGYATTVRPHMWKIRFNFDKTQIVIHKPMNLYDYIGELTNNFGRFNPEAIKKKIHLLRVEASHFKTPEGKSYTRRYTIHGFSKFDATKERIEEKNITIEKYFLNEYKIKLKYPQYQLIKTSPTKKTYVPMELLTVLPNQKVLINDPLIVSEVIRSAAIPAFDRLDKLRSAIKTLKFGDRADKFIKNYMIEIDDNLINVSGRVLDGPEANFGGRPEFLRGGKWDFRSKRFFQPAPNKINWALFAVGTERDFQRDEQKLYDIEEQLPSSANRVGVNMEPMFHFTYIPWQRIDIEVPNIIADSVKKNKRLDLLVFVINRDEDYKAVKRFGDMTFGIATQCMKLATLGRQRQMDQYLSNIMLKINTKLGGINWELMALINKNFSPIKGRFMVFGIDVTHPASNRNDLDKSIAAMVGSLDHAASLYGAVIRQQISKKEKAIVEVVLDTEDMVHKLLMNFYKANKTLKPDHLLFYRDGVSEGQFEIVFRHEIIAIQNACQRLQKDYQPKITYIVVQKRHKIRFFPSNPRDAIGKSGNVPAGTVVDKDITHCREFDFYLCSHEGIQGTSKPAHYHVLFDENNWGSDDLQSFTYFLCHVYARATRSVSYPAPTYYAHLAAFRGRALIGEVIDDSSSVASGTTQHSPTDSEIVIHDYHDNKLFFI